MYISVLQVYLSGLGRMIVIGRKLPPGSGEFGEFECPL